jgi:putative protease
MLLFILSGGPQRQPRPLRSTQSQLYNHRGKEGHFFSTSDLFCHRNGAAQAKAVVRSLKIEGRMKSAEYEASVDQANRTCRRPRKFLQGGLSSAKETFCNFP